MRWLRWHGGLKGLTNVTGTVTYQGKPVDGATVAFNPEGGGRAASGRTDASGKFQLTTLNANDGARREIQSRCLKGRKSRAQRAQITAEDMAKMVAGGKRHRAGRHPARGQKQGGIKHHVPEKYENAETSGLTAEVTDGGTNDFKFDLTD